MKFPRALRKPTAYGLFLGFFAFGSPFCALSQTLAAPQVITESHTVAQNSIEERAQNAPDSSDKQKPPSKYQQARRLQSENRLREEMRRCGITTTAAQDAILAYLEADEKGRAQVRGTARQLAKAIRGGALPERIKDLNADYKNALERDRLRRETARTALNAQVGYSFDPVVEGLLLLVGILGDGQSGVNLGTLFPQPPPTSTPFFGGLRGVETAPPNFAAPLVGGVSAISPRIRVFSTNNRWDLGVVMNKGDQSEGEMWIEIRADSGRNERLWPQWRGGAGGGFAPEMCKTIAQMPLGARVRFMAQNGRERQRLLGLEMLGNGALTQTVPNPTGALQQPTTENPEAPPAANAPATEPQETPF